MKEWLGFILLTVLLGGLLVWRTVAISEQIDVVETAEVEEAQSSEVSRIVRVDAQSAAGNADGSAWENAYVTLQDALLDAKSGDEIWVAAGVYYPDEGGEQKDNDRAATFQLVNGVAIYGGFAGTETQRSERDPEANLTVLSGDIDRDDSRDGDAVLDDTANIKGSNAYHVVTGSDTDSSALLDGVIITGGNANGDFRGDCGAACGGGIYNDNGSPTLTNLIIQGNFAQGGGGGIFNIDSSHPTLTDVTIRANATSGFGGGISNQVASHPTLNDVTITNNFALLSGGGMVNFASHPTLTDVTIRANFADDSGGGIANAFASHPTLTNVTITANTAADSAEGIANDESSAPTLTNVTLLDNEMSQ